MGIHKTRTTPLHPQSDGMVEQFNRTMGEQLAMFVSDHQRDWDQHLPLLLLSYRTAVHESMGCTPALLMFGRELLTPVDLAFGRPDPEGDPVLAGPEFAHLLQDHLDQAHQFARDHYWELSWCQKRAYDLQCKGSDLTVGENVWLYVPKRQRGCCSKLTFRHEIHSRIRNIANHGDERFSSTVQTS
ncbi:hypothetical protein EOD39_7563 [Acipenser ruthenus]|uniref:Integrase catalytic domain-containing protein n=1 Tax=Acipenser ruthenus TaxID=7906 RepID=A0A444U6K0_ACIRT|nr:hypothetical protein EOD39_7563 [Acipenser ruthenus]